MPQKGPNMKIVDNKLVLESTKSIQHKVKDVFSLGKDLDSIYSDKEKTVAQKRDETFNLIHSKKELITTNSYERNVHQIKSSGLRGLTWSSNTRDLLGENSSDEPQLDLTDDLLISQITIKGHTSIVRTQVKYSKTGDGKTMIQKIFSLITEDNSVKEIVKAVEGADTKAQKLALAKDLIKRLRLDRSVSANLSFKEIN